MGPSRIWQLCIGAGLLISPAALAGPVQIAAKYFETTGDASPGLEQQIGGFGQREVPGGSVMPSDQASMSLTMPGGLYVNEGGDKLVLRGQSPVSIGKNRNGVGQILAAWDEITTEDGRFVQALWQTSNGEDILPLGSPSFFWGWQFGVTDPVSFRPFITNVEVESATLALSRDSGASFFTLFSTKGGLDDPAHWDGRDPGIFQSSAGNGINLVLAMYKINPVPAPGALSAFAAVGLLAARRRR